MEDTVLHLRNVSKSYRRNKVLGPIDLRIRRGEIVGLVGENGAGKSTLIRLVTGLSRPTSGTVSLFGKTEAHQVNRQRARMGYLPDASALYPALSARENLDVRRTEWGIPGKRCIDEALETVGLASTGRKRVRNFSLGMTRRLDLAVALLGDPELLVLDEPTNGLDPMGIVEVRELLQRLNRERSVTILVSSHILAELHEMATRCVVLSGGKLLEDASTHELDARCAGNLEAHYARLVREGARR